MKSNERTNTNELNANGGILDSGSGWKIWHELYGG